MRNTSSRKKSNNRFTINPIILIDILLVVFLFLGVFFTAKIYSKDIIKERKATAIKMEEEALAKAKQEKEKAKILKEETKAKKIDNDTSDTTTQILTAQENEDTSKENSNSNQDKEQKQTEKEDISILFGGDFLFTQDVLDNFEEKGRSGLFSPDLQAIVDEATYTVANIDFVFTDNSEADANKEFTFKAEKEQVKILNELGIQMVNLANTHALDYGIKGLQETFSTLDSANIAYIGAGNQLEDAKATKIIELKGHKIGFLGIADVIPKDSWTATKENPGILSTKEMEIITKEIQRAKKECAQLIVYMNWGVEKSGAPTSTQQELAKKLIDEGADLIVGSHSHTLQGFELYNGKLIAYSLGNLLFNSNAYESMFLKVSISKEGELSYSMIPTKAGEARMWVPEEAQALYEELNEKSMGVYIEEGNLKTQTD